MITSHNCLLDISTDAHLGYRPFSGVPVSQNAFDPYSGQFGVDEPSLSYQEENHSRLIWNLDAQSSSSTDRWTATLLNRDPYSNHGSIPVSQSGDDYNVYPNLGICCMANNLAPSLDNSVADINFFPQFVGTTSGTSLGSHPRPVIAEEILSPNTLNTIGPDLLAVDHKFLTKTQAGSPDETFNSEMSPSNPDEHGPVQSAHLNTCIECQESFKNRNLLILHSMDESHAPFMCLSCANVGKALPDTMCSTGMLGLIKQSYRNTRAPIVNQVRDGRASKERTISLSIFEDIIISTTKNLIRIGSPLLYARIQTVYNTESPTFWICHLQLGI